MERLARVLVLLAASGSLAPFLGGTGLGAQWVRSGAFVTRKGDVEVARERYRFDGATLVADVELVGMGLYYQAQTDFDPEGSTTRYHLRIRRGVGGPLLRELDVTVDDSVRWALAAGGSSQRGSIAIGRPRAVVQNLVFSQLAASLRTYDRVKGGRQVVHAWLPEGGAVLPLTVELRGDSGTLEIGGVSLHLMLDGSGWVTRFDIPTQAVVVTAQEDVAFSSRVTSGGADTLPPEAITEEPYLVEGSGARLVGTLALPDAPGPVPVAVIVAGSGAVDRDGNAPPGVQSNLYAQLAWRLAERGIASLRYDKRGVGESRAGVNLAMTTLDDFAEDVLAASRALARDERFGAVGIVGHSEGGWLAIRAALRGAPAQGIALLATPGRPFLTVLRGQLAQQLDSAGLVQFDSAMAGYLRGEVPVGLPPYLQPLFRPVNQRFTASAVAFDALAELRRLEISILVVQGDRDIQIGVEDAERLAAAAPSARVLVIPGANHLFKAADRADRVAQLALYMDRTAPVVPELVEAIVDWMSGLPR